MSVDIETRVRQANPLTRDDQLEQLFGDDASLRLLRAIHDRREGRMTEQTEYEQTPPLVPDEPSAARRLRTRINPAIAIAAFLVVIAVGIALALAFRADEPDVVSPQSLAQSFIEARDTQDVEAALALFAPDAVIEDSAFTLRDAAGFFAWFEATGWRWIVDDCSQTSSGSVAKVTCEYTHHNAWTEALGRDPITGSFDFTIEDGKIVAMTHHFNLDDFGSVWGKMEGWILANDAYDGFRMYNADRSAAALTPESLALWKQATEEFVAERESGG